MKLLQGLLATVAMAAVASPFNPAGGALAAVDAAPKAETGSHVDLAGKVILLMSKLVDTLGSAKDTASATAAVARLDGIATEFETLAGQMVAVGKPTGAQKQKVEAMFAVAQKDLEKRMMASMGALITNPEVAETLAAGLQSFGERMERLSVMEAWTGDAGKAGSSAASEDQSPKPEVSPKPEKP